jgi:hypothetical protein
MEVLAMWMTFAAGHERERALAKPGFYLQSINAALDLVGAPFWLGPDPAAAIEAYDAIDEGFYAVLLKPPDRPAREWGTLSVWAPAWGSGGRQRWQLRARDGRPVAMPGHVIWSPVLPASLERGGIACPVQG